MKAVIYDLDGTLTNTLTDLYLSTNHALRQCGYPERSMEEVRRFVGNGVGRLIQSAVPEGCDAEQCLAFFKEHYMAHCKDNTALYPDVYQMMKEVKLMGLRTAIVSNKVQSGVDELYKRFFTGLVDVAIGERTGMPRKPAPDMVLLALKELGVEVKDCVYLGDSEVDVATARNCGMPCISVLWGFRTSQELIAAGATTLAHTPNEVIELLKKV